MTDTATQAPAPAAQPAAVAPKAAAPAAGTTVTLPSLSGAVSAFAGWLASAPFLHVAGIAAISVLMGIGNIPTSEGLPILTGLVGLGINTSTSSGS